MKKRNLLFIVVLISIMFIKVDVNAAGKCTKEELQALKTEALNLEFETELYHETDERAGIEYYYKVKVNNDTKNLIVIYEGSYYDYSIISKNNELSLPFPAGGGNISFEIMAATTTACPNEVLTTKKVNIPYYNAYSTRSECKGLEEFNICMTNSNTNNLTEEQFLEQIELAKKKQEEEKNKALKKKEDKEKTKIEEIVDIYMDNKFITIPITVLIVVVIVILIIRSVQNRKKKIKVDIGGL